MFITGQKTLLRMQVYEYLCNIVVFCATFNIKHLFINGFNIVNVINISYTYILIFHFKISIFFSIIAT